MNDLCAMRITSQLRRYRDFPGDPVVKTPPSQLKGHQFDP